MMDANNEKYTKFRNSYETRFSDFDENGMMRGNSALSFFESARFEITKRTRFAEMLMELLGEKNIIFPVVEVDLSRRRPISMTNKIDVVTYLKDVTVPLFTFRHILIDRTTGEECMFADLKVAVVVPDIGTIRTFSCKARQMINDTIHKCGEEVFIH